MTTNDNMVKKFAVVIRKNKLDNASSEIIAVCEDANIAGIVMDKWNRDLEKSSSGSLYFEVKNDVLYLDQNDCVTMLKQTYNPDKPMSDLLGP